MAEWVEATPAALNSAVPARCSVGDDVDIDGGPTELLCEAPSFLWTATSDIRNALHGQQEECHEAPLISLVSLNEGTAATVDFFPLQTAGDRGMALATISCGRADGLSIVLQDPRVSTHHFSIQARVSTSDAPPSRSGTRMVARPVELELEDESSNGTWLNEEKVGKGHRVPLVSGDRIFVLPAARVGQEAIGYVVIVGTKDRAPEVPRKFLTTPGQPRSVYPSCTAVRKATGEASKQLEAAVWKDGASEKLRLEEEEKLQRSEALKAQLAASTRCRCCGESPVHRCATAVPCGHHFDLGCMLAKCQSSLACSECNIPIRQLVRNRALDNLAETFKKTYPEAEREPLTIALLEEAERHPSAQPLLNRLLLGNPGKSTSFLSVPWPPSLLSERSSLREAAAELATPPSLPEHLAHLEPFGLMAVAALEAAAAAREAPGPEQPDAAPLPDAAPAPPPGQTPRADGRSAACVVS